MSEGFLADGELSKQRERVQRLTLNARQLHQAHELANPDSGDTDQEEAEVTIAWMPAGVDTDGAATPQGFYAWLTEYPEEGALFLDPDRPIAASAPAAPLRMPTDDELAECCGGCRTTSAANTWMRRAIAKTLELNAGRVIPPATSTGG